MTYLLSRRGRETLAQLAWAQTLLAFDFDGTLAPIVSQRDTAAMRPSTLALLRRLCALYPAAVISGRSRADVAGRLGDAQVKYVIGNHGSEPGTTLRQATLALREARGKLGALVRRTAGLELEDKGYSLAVHYRRAPAKAAARAAIVREVKGLSAGLRVVSGICVINVVPAQSPDKGDAVVSLRARSGADIALYVGDDVTDEDVFRLDQPGQLLSVRIGRSRASAATYFLDNQPEIDVLMRTLITLRETSKR